MTGRVTNLWRHPIKSHGREEMKKTSLIAGQTMPGDRVWAVAHEHSKADGSQWEPCANFSRVSKAPQLMAITSQSHDDGQITLSHPARADLTFDPRCDQNLFLDWVRPLMPESRAASARLVQVPGRGMTDSDFPSITLCNAASHRAVERQIGHSLSPLRWRGNIWFDGLPEWEEFNWIGHRLRIGTAEFVVRERTDRCLATTANPATGERDTDTLGALDHWNHQDFSVRAECTTSGEIEIGDRIERVT